MGKDPDVAGEREVVESIAAAIENGSRVELSRAITLVESRNPSRRSFARELLTRLNRSRGNAHRIGMTGAPGAGKSTLIDSLGTLFTSQGSRVAILAVDPSSTRSRGAILGDKTRMARLASDTNAFVRPSPSSGTLGGVTRATRETILLCEAAGFDIVIVETVGVGQSETAVAAMTDCFLVLMLAGGGDELQGIKKGIMELADIVAVTKADGGNEIRARSSAADYRAALQILTPFGASWKPPVMTLSAQDAIGLDELAAAIRLHRQTLTATGEFDGRRRDQDVGWMHAMADDRLREAFFAAKGMANEIAAFERDVRSGALPPSVAADLIVASALKHRG